MKKVLFIVTSHAKLGDTGKTTGYYLSEVTHPWEALGKDFEISVASPKGGDAPVDGLDLSDPISRKFWEDPQWRKIMANTLRPEEVRPQDYAAIFYAGGHGVMWDFPDNKQLADICSQIYEQGGIVSAVCHGPAGLLNVFLKDGKRLIDGRKLTSFSNAEENLAGTASVVPFLLQTALEKDGAIYSCEKPWSDYVVVDGRLVTGQNPQSALSLGKTLRKMLA
ncbi:MAG: type 1 glutamine amidotransferase domain-containing protein [Desulfovibrio sp.]|nr:type 1 glutamine amidotransferase domain-containing protein [Desulfovibrio sp.]